MIYEDLKDDFQAYGLSVANVSITNHDFSAEKMENGAIILLTKKDAKI
jgi:hypothetical protein